ncbi:MAG: lipolytic enzyme [Tardiphaga sp.]|nr:lipolytic enzyme [Tardiphaga sp.]
MSKFRTIAALAAITLASANAPLRAQTPAPATTSSQPVTTAPAEAPKGLAGKAIDKVKDAALAASDTIFGRVPCRKPKNGPHPMGALPRVAGRLAAGKPVRIIAFGSSSTQGYGSSRPEFNYPNRLAAQLRRQYPSADIAVINQGIGGEDAPEMMKRLKTAVLDANPDLVIWQVGTNAIVRNLDPAETAKLVDEGIGMIKAVNADLVLIDPQFSPRVQERAEGAGKMVQLLHKIAELRKVGIFPRFDVMREWHEGQDMSFDKFVIADGLHMNDWGYACFAQLLGDDIIRSVGQIKLGANTPDPKAEQQANKGM